MTVYIDDSTPQVYHSQRNPIYTMSHHTSIPHNTSHRVRPIPKRLCSLQPEPHYPDPHFQSASTSPTHAHTSPGTHASFSLSSSTSTSSSSSTTHTRPPSRPSAPKRSHSFCGDPSTSNYALASATACAHLSADKRKLVAPPLERTLSSTGFPGPPGTQISKPISRDPLASYPLSQSMSNSPMGGHRTGSLPKIVVSSPRTRPGLNPIQRSPKLNNNKNTSSTSFGSGRMARSQSLVSNASSRASSYIVTTPMAGTIIPPHYDLSVSRVKSTSGWDTKNVEFALGHGEEEEDDMMVVDDMVERIEELAV